MKNAIRHVLLALVVVASVAPAGAAERVTVGDFLKEIAHAKQVPAASGDVALQQLRNAGLALPALDVNAMLTEGAVVEIASSLGISVTTSRPESPFSQSQMNAFVDVFGSALGVAPKAPSPYLPFNEQKGKKKGHHKSKCDLDDH